MPAKKLTAEQQADADRLKALFKAWQRQRADRGEAWSQDYAGDQLVFGQSALNQYLNGKIPLNPEAAAKFAGLIGCHVADFSETIDEEIRGFAQQVDRLKPSPLQQIPRVRAAQWPFTRLDEQRMRSLDDESALRLETAILLAAAQLKINIERAPLGKRRSA
ncbi:helix-turn-helix domain-containing protein [Variovorax sp. PAMC 28711]|uniref:helix-turn-helix domain-containing protein n=1 Tax=Variovorax sp. PAMC 28711 TaxID=1795631 RepID=UPI00078C6E21|nr:helix-turn-helix transcriptional regulator [Variovorax sp. PAMC 28711]AMM23017.1 hypothetical protein AX767_00435 [Variovorax sp. PAMC 28711]